MERRRLEMNFREVCLVVSAITKHLLTVYRSWNAIANVKDVMGKAVKQSCTAHGEGVHYEISS
jgi:hypothetical protein